MKLRDYLAQRAVQKLERAQASLQDLQDLRRKGQVRREDRAGVEKTMDRVNERIKHETRRLARLAQGRLPDKGE